MWGDDPKSADTRGCVGARHRRARNVPVGQRPLVPTAILVSAAVPSQSESRAVLLQWMEGMPHASSPQSEYVLGTTDRERQRLIHQAELLRDFTVDAFLAAGLAQARGEKMRVLDIGCGS